MAKEKTSNLQTKEQERLFHYEVIGIITLIACMFAITKMGIVGRYLMLITKVLFGDWYFLIYGLLIFYAIRCIIIHKKFKMNSIRYFGVFILIIAIILLSHFSMHHYIKDYEGNYLIMTYKLYFNSFKTETPEAIIGGGMVGATLFYLCYYLLSEVGVVLISLIIIFLGIVFISKKTIKDFIKTIFNYLTNFYHFLKKTTSKLKNKVDEYDKSYNVMKNKTKKYKIMKVNTQTFYEKEYEFAKRNVETIKKVLNSMNVFYNDISYIICRNITVYFINSYFPFSYQAFERNLKNYFHNFQLKQDDLKKELLVEINSLNIIPLRVSEINKLEDDEVVFGIDDRNEFLKLNNITNKLLVMGQSHKLISNYLDTIIISLCHYKSKITYNYLDFYHDSEFSTSIDHTELATLITKINEKITKYNDLKVQSIEEYNQKSFKKDHYQLIIINGLEKIINDDLIIDKIKYLLEVSNNYGYLFIFTTCSENVDNNTLYNLFNYKLFLEKETACSKKYLGYQRFDLIKKDVEGYLLYKSVVLRCALLMLSEEEKKP